MKEYLVEWEKYNKCTTEYDTGKFQENVEAESELEAVELVKQYIFDNSHDEYLDREITDDGIDFDEFQYCNFIARPITGNNLISLAEYAEIHGVTPDTVRQRANRGVFKTARKIGRNWVIDKNEPYIDNRRKDK